MSYKFEDHLHNYAVWTAARSAQRGFTTTANIAAAIDATQLRILAKEGSALDSKEFDEFQKKTAYQMINLLSSKGIEASYGRVAKIISIYLKTAVVLPSHGQSPLAKVAHPPIDRILLTNLHREHKELDLKGINWTELNEDDYFKLISKLRPLAPDAFWRLEEYWKAS